MFGFYPRHTHWRHHRRWQRMGMGRLLLGLLFAPLIFKRAMRWHGGCGHYGGYGGYGGCHGGPRDGYGWRGGPRAEWRSGPHGEWRGPRGPHGPDYV